MRLFRKKRPAVPAQAPSLEEIRDIGLTRDQAPTMPLVLATKLPWNAIANMWRNLTALLRDNRGKMSSKRFGAGALIAAGIAQVLEGNEVGNITMVYSGLALCALGVVLFALTRLETHDQ